ncbi:uncharacterized protein LOC142320438 isoform X2 [Lycorma delicatula]|uniref:uncharacterized protein LOC142320438 isoform X2 n=1 Tax=Lycorma delicatula TaxID=130591 RepID=UPI003F512935
MDPVGPWSAYAASYNRLANTTGVTGTSDYHQLAAIGVSPTGSHAVNSSSTATTSHQLLLQAAHVSSSAVTSPSSFNPGRFLSPPPVGYDVFSPLFHQKAHYSSALNQRHQTLKHHGAAAESSTTAAADIVGSYGTMHHQTLAAAAGALFDHQTSTPSTPYQPTVAHAQLHSPFGILPHESVLNGRGSTSQKINTAVPFENTFNAHIGGTQTVNRSHDSNTVTISDFSQENVIINASNKKSDRTPNSPLSKTTPVISHSSSAVKSLVNNVLYHPPSGGLHSQHQSVPTITRSASKFTCKCGLNCTNLQSCQSQQQVIIGHDVNTTTSPPIANNNSINNYQNVNKSCLQSNSMFLSNNINNNKTQLNVGSTTLDRRLTSSDVQLGEQSGSGQSSPVCFAMSAMPSLHRPIANYNSAINSGVNLQARSSPRNLVTSSQYHSPHRPVVSPVPYCQNTAPIKSSPVDMIGTTTISVTQKSPDCTGVVVPRMPSPLQAHLQSSPLSHVPSPAYPIYNSPVTSIHSPTHQIQVSSITAAPCQQHNYNMKQTGSAREGTQESLSPLDVTMQRRSVHESLNGKSYVNPNSDCVIQTASTTSAWELVSSEQEQLSSSGKATAVISSSAYGAGSALTRNDHQAVYFDCCIANQTSENAKQNSSNEKKITESCMSANSPSSLVKHKKNLGKNTINADTFGLNIPSMGRIPPPAHNNNLQQNDNYVDYERWNLSGSMKISNERPSPDSNLTECSSKTSNSSSSPCVNTEHQSNQSLNLPSAPIYPSHHNPPQLSTTTMPPSISFCNNLPLSNTPTGINVSLNSQCESSLSNDLQNISVELSAGSTEASVSSESQNNKAIFDEQPKVIVPNIEEELDFLNNCNLAVSSEVGQRQMSTTTMPEKKISNSNTGGFMASYIKFLQVSGKTPTTVPPQCQSSNAPSYNPEDDPRYFPLPKTSAHRGSLDSSDEDLDNINDAELGCLNKKKNETVNSSSARDKTGTTETTNKLSISDLIVPSDTKADSKNASDGNITVDICKNINDNKNKKNEVFVNKGKSNKTGIDSNKKSNKKPARRRRQRSSDNLDADVNDKGNNKLTEIESNENVTPQRTVPKRKAKENFLTKTKGFSDGVDDDEDSDNDDEDEDEDFEPDWTPADDDDDGQYGRAKRKRGSRPLLRSSYNTRRSTDSGSRRSKRRKSENVDTSTRNSSSRHIKSEKQNTAKRKEEKNETNNSSRAEANGNTGNAKEYFRYSCAVNEFVALKQDLVEEWPTIWRVDGKSLLQKFEPFEQNGETLYKNIPTYSGFSQDHVYKSVPTRIRSQNRGEIIIELLRSEIDLTPVEQKIVDTAMENTFKYQDHFEVYIQTLISQALDSNFLAEIIQEKDEYFLINMKAIDDVTEDHRQRFIKCVGWQNRILEQSLSTWPCYNVLYGLKNTETTKACESCDAVDAANRVIAYGQPYNNENLEGRPPDPEVQGHKELSVCRDCVSKVSLYNKVVHQKYLMFVECAKRVSEKRSIGPEKDTTVILNELLADEIWLSHLFTKVRSTWAQVSRLENSVTSEKTSGT